jgi:hypothetical protein
MVADVQPEYVRTSVQIWQDNRGRRFEAHTPQGGGKTRYFAEAICQSGGAQAKFIFEIHADSVEGAFDKFDETMRAAGDKVGEQMKSDLTRAQLLGVRGVPGGNGRGMRITQP